MRIAIMLLSCVATAALLEAQAQPGQSDKPYQEGDVDKFLVHAKEQGRPAIVLFNFSLESG